jgi:uncharacterized cupredoxin-like copper-binding protein
MTPSRPPARLGAALVVLLAFAAAGCSDDDDAAAPSSTMSTEAPADVDARPANAVTIGMTEYAFNVSGSVTAGATTVVMANTGQELHMTAFGLLADGRTLEDVRRALASEDEASFDEVFERQLDAPGGLLGPGRTMEVTSSFLEAGTYALMCFLPTVGEAVPHTAKGMLAGLEVAEGDAALDREADARYVVDEGKVEGPTTLAAGEVTLEMRSGEGGPHEFTVARKKTPSTTVEEIDEAFTALFDAEMPPPPGYADTLPAVIAGSTFDVDPGGSILLTVDLEPGHYLIGCAREPDDESTESGRPHTGELLEVEVT